ncbi:putative universal stress protein A [Helianthus annuus]|uniref:Universal stress protein A n=1 Tax=Helianthus annuus TaxID=4232 RepID=A0A251UBS4_HELAN|nr:putative universal stress protein A [Helianthus annuus]KAJ0905460.1 putative universal stress protein A [Helianthus annuus]
MKVLVSIDESEGSLYALQWALEHLYLPEIEGSAAITVVHVQPHTAVPAGAASVIDSVKKAQEESASEVISRATKLCEQHMIKAEMMVIRGNPKEMIVDASEDMNADLLVVGSRGLGQIKRAFLGSVSDYCVHHAKCPVLIVRPPKSSPK